MALLSVTSEVGRIWICDQNPLNLDEPPLWWQTLVHDYDKMLRILPSQRERMYRLCRLVRREARLGLQALVLHDHPDTRACIKFGVVPVAALYPWAIRSDKIIRDLYARDTWRHHGGDPNKLVDAIEKGEYDVQQKADVESAQELDELSSNAYRAIRYGRPTQVDLGSMATPRTRRTTPADLPALPLLPGETADDRIGVQFRDRVDSESPAEGTATPSLRIHLTDL